MKFIIHVLLNITVVLVSQKVSGFLSRSSLDPLIGKTTPQIISYYGYPVESHIIRTEDNYLLEYFRIPYGKSSRNGPRPPVLLMHPLFASSQSWFLQEQNSTLPLILAEEGYDVWLGNSRGVSYSTRIEGLIPFKNTSYWNFSYDEMGRYDLPAAIDYILDVTRHEQIFYIGHSQGTTIFFVMLSFRPEYNLKIRLMVAMAPVAYSLDIKGISRLFHFVIAPFEPKDFGNTVTTTLTRWGLGQILPVPIDKFLLAVLPHFCGKEPFRTICKIVYYSIVGFNFQQANDAKWPLAVTALEYTSLQNFIHFHQVGNQGKFQQYDFGPTRNFQMYKSPVPPQYKVSRIQAPIGLFHGQNDFLATPAGVQRILERFPNIVYSYEVPDKLFNHGDFLIAKDAYTLVYKDVIQLVHLYNTAYSNNL